MKVCEWKLLMLVNVRNCMPGFVCQGLLYVTPMFVRLNRVRVACRAFKIIGCSCCGILCCLCLYFLVFELRLKYFELFLCLVGRSVGQEINRSSLTARNSLLLFYELPLHKTVCHNHHAWKVV